MKSSGLGRVNGVCACPTICAGVVSTAGVQKGGTPLTPPPQRIISLPVILPVVAWALLVLVATSCRCWVVSPTSVFDWCRRRRSSHCQSRLLCVRLGLSGALTDAGSCPTIGVGIVSPAGIPIHGAARNVAPPQTIISLSLRTAVCPARAAGDVAGAGGDPAVDAGIISPAGIQVATAIDTPQTIISLPVHTAV